MVSGIIIIIKRMPRAGAQRFPRGASSVLDPGRISKPSWGHDYEAGDLLPGYVATCGEGVREGASTLRADPGLRFWVLWRCQVTHPSLPRDRRVEADFSESAETAAVMSQLEVEPWRWLHDPRMVYREYEASTLSNKARVRAHVSEPYNKTGWM